MSERKAKLLVIDDDREIAALVGQLAERAGYLVDIVSESREVEDPGRVEDADTIVLDLQMPGLDGVQVLRALAAKGATAGVILVSGMDNRTRKAAEAYGKQQGLNVLTTVEKPFFPEEFLQILCSAYAASLPLTSDDLEAAISRDELFLLYQPTVSRFGQHSWRINSMEALLRWDHPTRGVLGPEHFISMSEDSGLIVPLSDFVIQRGLEQLKAWKAAQIGLGVRLNLPATLLTDLEFPDRLDALITELEVDPEDITLEITETAMLGGHPNTVDILTRFRLKNIQLAIDDFGIGYSSLTQLFRMPFNEMKIDKSLLMHLPESDEARIMVQALVNLAHNLGLTACAEGVESDEALGFLSQIECDFAQGFYICEPVPARSIASLIRESRFAIAQPRETEALRV